MIVGVFFLLVDEADAERAVAVVDDLGSLITIYLYIHIHVAYIYRGGDILAILEMRR